MIALPAAAGDAPAAAAPRNPEVLRRVRAPLGPGPIRGPADAKVTVLAFVDYQCPFSAKAEATIDELVARHPRDLRVQLVPRPLPTHAHADLAARAAIAAGLQGKRWEMHRALFAEQRALGPALVQQQATRLGLDLARFRSDLDGKVVRDELDGEIARARRLGVGSTPTFLLNGRFVTGAHPVEALSALVAEEIGYADEILARGVPAARLYEVILANVPEPNAGDLVVRDRGSAALAKCAPTPEAQEALRGLRIEADGTQRWPQPPSAAQAKLGACLVAELRGAPLVLRPAGEAPRDLPRNLDFAEGAAADPRAAAVPPGWGVTGSAPNDFHFGVERSGGAEGKPALVVRAAAPAPRGFGALVQNVKPGRYAGRRVRLSAQMRTAGVERWTGLWMRVDPNLAFDNMFKRPLKGTTGWARQEIVLDVPVAAKNLAIGVLVNGPGEVRVSDVRLEVVGEEVPVTATPGDLAELFAK
jgi:protein-disulfide isomerase